MKYIMVAIISVSIMWTSHVISEEFHAISVPMISEGISHSAIMVDQKTLLSLIQYAEKHGGMLNVAAYVFDNEKQVWNRARTICKEK